MAGSEGKGKRGSNKINRRQQTKCKKYHLITLKSEAHDASVAILHCGYERE